MKLERIILRGNFAKHLEGLQSESIDFNDLRRRVDGLAKGYIIIFILYILNLNPTLTHKAHTATILDMA